MRLARANHATDGIQFFDSFLNPSDDAMEPDNPDLNDFFDTIPEALRDPFDPPIIEIAGVYENNNAAAHDNIQNDPDNQNAANQDAANENQHQLHNPIDNENPIELENDHYNPDDYNQNMNFNQDHNDDNDNNQYQEQEQADDNNNNNNNNNMENNNAQNQEDRAEMQARLNE
jgi:hypothetical protein